MKTVIQKLAKKTLGDVYDRLVLPKHFIVALGANIIRRFPAKNLKVIGVTGTNGKTSTCFFIHSILYKAGYRTGLMTTVGCGVDNQIEPQITHMTSQPIQVTLKWIMKMQAEDKLDWLVLEVTSQALAQFRILGIPIDIAVMTNVTHEHLDYHTTFERYLNAKLKLFRLANRHKKGRRLGIVNANDGNAVSFVDVIENVVAYSPIFSNDKTIAHPSRLKLHLDGSSYTLEIEDDCYNIVCNLPGSFNVDNSMAAALVGRAIGLNQTQIEEGIKALETVEGRMINIEEGQDFTVIVDFAHTPDSFERIFKDLKPLVKGRLIALFGSPGRRDKIKRGVQGKIAGHYADILILTEDDHRDEDGQTILKQIAKGAAQADKKIGKDVFLVLDRSQAIKKALKEAQKGDMVLLLGKGHEKSIARADGDHYWDEVEIARRHLKTMLNKDKKPPKRTTKSKKKISKAKS